MPRTTITQIGETPSSSHFREIEDCGVYWVCVQCETRLDSAEDYCLCKGFRREDNGSVPTTEE